MSGQVVGWAMKQQTGSPAAKLVLVKLADNSGDEGLAWPSVQLIAEHTELGQSTVYRHLATLEGQGLISRTTVTVHPGTGPEYACEGWQLSVPAEWKIPRAGKRTPALGNTIPAARKSIPAAGKPYKEEPSLEPPLNLAPFDAALKTRLERLAAVIGNGHFNTWFGDAEFIDGTPFKIAVSKEFKRNRIKERYLSKLGEIFGHDVLVLLAEDANA